MNDLKKLIEKINQNKRIKIRLNNSTKSYGLYLDYIENCKREKVFLDIRIPKSDHLSKNDKEIVYVAELIRDKKEIELYSNETGFSLKNKKSNVHFLTYFKELAKKKNLPSYYGSIKQLSIFLKSAKISENITFSDINTNFCKKFRDFLVEAVANPTAKTYLVVFKATLEHGKANGIISENPCSKVSIALQENKRKFLNENDLKLFISSNTIYKEIKNAFIFSAQTSLRLGDIRKIKFSNISDGYLYYQQNKTNGVLNIKISKLGMRIIKEQEENNLNSEYIFNLPKSKSTINNKLNEIAKSVNITEKISFHVARHSFATLGLAKDGDIYTISKYMGHSSVTTTEIYCNLVDSKLDELADLINIDIE